MQYLFLLSEFKHLSQFGITVTYPVLWLQTKIGYMYGKVKMFLNKFLCVFTYHHASFTAHWSNMLLHISFVVISFVVTILLEALQDFFCCHPMFSATFTSSEH